MSMNWLLAAMLLVFGGVCGAIVRLTVMAVVMLAASVVALVARWGHGAWSALLEAVIVVLLLQIGYAAGVVLRASTRPLRERRGEPREPVRGRAVRLPNEPKQR